MFWTNLNKDRKKMRKTLRKKHCLKPILEYESKENSNKADQIERIN